MNFNNGTVERNGFYFDTKQLFFLKALKYAVRNTVFAPTVHACVDAMPTAEVLRQTTPLTTMFRYIEDCIQHLEVVKMNISPLAWKAIRNSLVLFICYLHNAWITPMLMLNKLC